MDQIDRARLERFVAGLVKKGLARASIKQILAALSVLFTNAIEKDVVDRNPVRGLGKLYRRAPVRHEEIQPLSAIEVGTFLGKVLEEAPEHYPLFLTAIHTGMRSGELAGLQWADIDWANRSATVRRNFTHGRLTSTKNGKARRVDLSDCVIEALQRRRKELREHWLKKGSNEIPKWVFSNSAGSPPSMHNLKSRQFKTCLERAGLRRIRFHDLRHTYATLLIQNGEPIAYVKDQLGHSTIRMTVDTYTHWMPGSNREAVNRLPAVVAGP